MPLSNKQREENESLYTKTNDCRESVCNGFFYIANQKRHEGCKFREYCSKYKMYNLMKNVAPNVKFRHVASFRKCNFYYKYTIDEETIVKDTTYNIKYMNELALSFIIDLKTYRRDMDKNADKIVRAIFKRTKEYERNTKNILGEFITKYCDINDEMDGIFMPKVKKLMALMQLYLRTNGIKQYKLIGYLELIRFLCCFSSEVRAKNIEFASVLNKNVLSLRAYSLNEIVPMIDNLMNWLLRKEEFDRISLNDDKNVMEVFNDLRVNALNLSNIHKCVEKYESKD